jgi:hypothetical protein
MHTFKTALVEPKGLQCQQVILGLGISGLEPHVPALVSINSHPAVFNFRAATFHPRKDSDMGLHEQKGNNGHDISTDLQEHSQDKTNSERR